MGIYHAVKNVVPLRWRIGFHTLKTESKDKALRVTNRASGQLPIPPKDLIHLVAGHRSAQWFLDGGRTASAAIRETLNKNGIDIAEFGTVLDFGCGSGRIMRQWSTTAGPVWHGTDYNPQLIEWCKNNLKFAEFRVNALSGGLSYDSETFDFIYSFSVFTHLKESLQFFWINELSRVLKPGGYIYFTTHGEYYLTTLSQEEQERFRSGQLVVKSAEQSGSNICGAFHPPSYVREKLAQNFTLVDFIPSGASGDSMHDVYLLKKPARKLN